jgi:hypothetical protein
MGFGLLYIIYIDGQLMEKWIDFVKIKFHLWKYWTLIWNFIHYNSDLI